MDRKEYLRNYMREYMRRRRARQGQGDTAKKGRPPRTRDVSAHNMEPETAHAALDTARFVKACEFLSGAVAFDENRRLFIVCLWAGRWWCGLCGESPCPYTALTSRAGVT